MIKPILAKSSLVALLTTIVGTSALAIPLVNSPEVSSESVSSEKVSRDANGVNAYSNEVKVAQVSQEDQAVAIYLSTASSIGGSNYAKRGDFPKAVSDVSAYFARPLGVPLRRSSDGRTVFVRLRDGSTVSARPFSRSFGNFPTVQITRPRGKGDRKVRYSG